MNKNNKGFTLIELMITVAIVGLLGSVAIPAYQDYVARSQVSEGIALSAGIKTPVTEHFSVHNELPNSNRDLAIDSIHGRYVEAVRVSNSGQILATLGNDVVEHLRGEAILLTPTQTSQTNLSWACESTAPQRYLPSSCQAVSFPSWRTKGANTAVFNENKRWDSALPRGINMTFVENLGLYYNRPMSSDVLLKELFVTPDGSRVYEGFNEMEIAIITNDGKLLFVEDGQVMEVTETFFGYGGEPLDPQRIPSWLTDYMSSDGYRA